MTEHERMVNDADIKAYERMEGNMFSKIPGFGGSHEADRQRSMVERAFGAGNSPAQFSKKADVYIGAGGALSRNTGSTASAPYLHTDGLAPAPGSSSPQLNSQYLNNKTRQQRSQL